MRLMQHTRSSQISDAHLALKAPVRFASRLVCTHAGRAEAVAVWALHHAHVELGFALLADQLILGDNCRTGDLLLKPAGRCYVPNKHMGHLKCVPVAQAIAP